MDGKVSGVRVSIVHGCVELMDRGTLKTPMGSRRIENGTRARTTCCEQNRVK